MQSAFISKIIRESYGGNLYDSCCIRWCGLHWFTHSWPINWKGVRRGSDRNLITGHRAAVNPKARFYQGDIHDRAFLDEVFNKETDVEGVIHFAAFSIVPESMKDPLKYFDNNTGGMITLLKAMRDHNIKRIIFSSTAATYGEPKQIPIKETDPQIPTNPYGESKLCMEKIIHWSDLAYGIKFVALRYFNVAGAKADGSIGEDHHPETHLIPIIFKLAAGERTGLKIFGTDYPTKDGTNVRDYVHVVDLADAHSGFGILESRQWQ